MFRRDFLSHIGATISVAMASFTWFRSRQKPQKTEPLLLVVMGGILPFQQNASLEPVARTPQMDGNSITVRTILPREYGYDEVMPYRPVALLHSEIQIGTIDQLVEHYRQQLTQGYVRYQQASGIPDKTPEEIQTYLQEVREDLRVNDHGVTIVPYRWHKPNR